MSNDKTDLLTRIAPPPAHPRASTAAPDGGTTWPEDLAHLYSVYGTGSFDIFISILANKKGEPYISSAVATRKFLEALEETISFDETVRPLLQTLREASTVTVWASTDNGDQCLWLPPTSKAPQRVIIIDSKCTEWATYKTNVTEIPPRHPHRRYRLPVFSDGFPSIMREMRNVTTLLNRPPSLHGPVFPPEKRAPCSYQRIHRPRPPTVARLNPATKQSYQKERPIVEKMLDAKPRSSLKECPR